MSSLRVAPPAKYASPEAILCFARRRQTSRWKSVRAIGARYRGSDSADKIRALYRNCHSLERDALSICHISLDGSRLPDLGIS